VFTVGIAITRRTAGSSNDIVTANHLIDYSYIIASGRALLVRCSTGLGPTGDDNTVLGGWYFSGSKMSNGVCTGPVVQPRGSPISNFVGVIQLHQCNDTFSTTFEGVYTCTMMNSSMMNQSMRLGIYFTGRSESFDSTVLYIVTI